ncbi:ABC transporter integral membrane type 1 [Penicillium malachiteum]|nr:ABC transporter integral membrane type 1 [Penicillium malachiteum]
MQPSEITPSDIATADEEWLIDLCHKAEKDGGMIGGNRYGNKVIKISDRVVVKYGGAQESEASIQHQGA